MADRIGQQLGNYRLVRLLGRGGFAEVYLGEHLHLKNYAALKVLRSKLSDEDIAKFLKEGQTLARLTHPQIVRVHDFAVEEGMPFLVMDYAPRGTLRQRHPGGSCLPLDTVVTYVKHIAAALQYAHNRHVIHRDVKPENMLLGENREVLLSDFGIALFAPSPEMLSTQEMAGTLPYMAPEQLQGKPCFASDQYALGIVVYEWFCGVRPFEGSYWQLLNQHMSVLPPPLREKDPSLPEEVENVVLKALAKDPGQRYVSVNLFAKALERASQTGAGVLRNDSEETGSFSAISPAPLVVPRRIFLSSSPVDNPFVARLQADLQRQGITVWNEHRSSASSLLDQEQENVLRQAIRAVDTVVLVVSSHTRTSHLVKEHLRVAALYQRRLIYVWAMGEDLSSLLPEARGTTVSPDVIDARETRYRQALNELVACLAEERDVPTPEESTLVETLGEPRNPYKGLRAFTGNDAPDFFGRETLIGELVDGAAEILRSEQSSQSPARLLAVIGPSGSGKSSVVMAGLLPRLQQDALLGSKEWVYLSPMVPGAHPLEALALTLAPHLPDRSLKSIREDLEDDSARGLYLLTSHLIKGAEKKVVLFIDQFEEAFNLTTSESERERFFALLLTAITERKGPVLAILTLRADFYDRLMAASELGRLIQRHQLVVWPMEVDELRAAIKGPASLHDVGLIFEGNLLGDLLYEVRGQVGALPLLQFTLDQLFERRKDCILTQQAYKEIGGVKGALSKHAEKTYLALPLEKHRGLTRTLFLRLIDPGVTEQDTTRRRATLTELVFEDSEQTRLMHETMDLFVKARLLTTNASERAETTIEVSHEALIREWPRLVEWLREAREDIRLQHTISEDATSWEHNGQSSDRLYRGTQLKEAQEWARRNAPSRQEQAFLHASAMGRLHTLVIVIGVVLLVLTSLGIAGWFVLFPPNSQPKSNYVTNVQNDGSGSLRWAIANTNPGSTITFASDLAGKTINLTTADIHILNQKLTIQGPSRGYITIREIGASLVVDRSASVTISGLAFQGSNVESQLSLILNQGKLILTNCTASGNTTHIAAHTFTNDATATATAVDPSSSSTGGGIYNSGTLTMTNCTVSGNTATSSATHLSYGGGIDNAVNGTLTIMNSTVSGNTSSDGGGIYNSGTLTMTNSTISGNTSSYDGGIYNGGTLTMTNSTVSGNTAASSVSFWTDSDGGGGIGNGGTITMVDSSVSNNTSTSSDPSFASYGGGINNIGGTLIMTNSTISGNSSEASGGGIESFEGALKMMNSTISGNTSAAFGGGIYSIDGAVTMMNSTIFGNSASTYGGGILIQSITGNRQEQLSIAKANLIFNTISGNRASKGADIAVEDGPQTSTFEPSKQISQVQIRDSIVGENDAQDSPIAGVITLGGYNVIQHMSSANFNSGTDHVTDRSVDDLTGVFGSHPQLQNNGGPTQTLALLSNPQNPALNMIPLSACQMKEIYDTNLHMYTDERGMPRPGKNKRSCDVGAYEYQS